MKFKSLSQREKEILQKTISPSAVFWLIQDALFKKEGASLMRFADGEYRVLGDSKLYSGKFKAFGDGWNIEYGLEDMDIQLLAQELRDAGNQCKYLAPSISGVWWDIYAGWNNFNERPFYVDNFYPYKIADEEINLLLNSANGVCYIHRDGHYATNAKERVPSQNIEHLTLNSYKDIPSIKESIKNSSCQLFLWSGGPIGKTLGVYIQNLNKVGIDIGSAMNRWA